MAHWRKRPISFFVSAHCNLDCIYCYMPKLSQSIEPNDVVIDLDFAATGMREFFRDNQPHIRFFSAGEATCAFDRMVEIYHAARSLAGPDLVTELQTNGFFDRDVCNWVAEHVDIVWISIDGPAQLHDPQRPTRGDQSSHGTIEANLKQLLQDSKTTVGVRATFMPDNFHRQLDVLRYFSNLGVRYVCGAPTYSSLSNLQVKAPPLLDFAKQFLPAYNWALVNGMFYQTHLMVNFDEEVDVYCRACSSPPAPHLTSDGYVTCCDWASLGPEYLSGPLKKCIYGKWNPVAGTIDYFDHNRRQIEERNARNLSAGACRDCEVVSHCAGGCLGKVVSRTGDFMRVDPSWCEAVQYLAQHIPTNAGGFPVFHS